MAEPEGTTSRGAAPSASPLPYRAGNAPLAERYEAPIAGSRGLRFVELDRALLRSAALLLAATRMRVPDALARRRSRAAAPRS